MNDSTKEHTSVCVIVAHADDEVLGCGGTVAKFSQKGCNVNLLVVADGESSRVEEPETDLHGLIEAREFCCIQSMKVLGIQSVNFLRLPDNRLDSVDLLQIIKPVEKFIGKHCPSLVLTHFVGDLNVDHSVVNKAVTVAVRPSETCSVKELACFETVSSTDWAFGTNGLFNPNYFVDISGTFLEKMSAMKYYTNEVCEPPHPRSLQNLEALAKFRGAQSGSKMAEAFMTTFRID